MMTKWQKELEGGIRITIGSVLGGNYDCFIS